MRGYILPVMCLIALGAATAEDKPQEKGASKTTSERVRVIADKATIYKGQVEVATADKGTLLNVTERREGWVGVTWKGRGIELSGWIAVADVEKAAQATGGLPPPPPSRYDVIETTDGSYVPDGKEEKVVRTRIKVAIHPPVNRERLTEISEDLIEKEKESKPVNGIEINYYAAGSDTSGLYTAGRGVWAPHGKLEDCDQVKTGQYNSHQLVVSVGNAAEDTRVAQDKAMLKDDHRKAIFWEILILKGRSMKQEEIIQAISDHYFIAPKTVQEIEREGLSKSWPKPPKGK
jgi:hypothetical protein